MSSLKYDFIVISGPTASYKSLIADMLYDSFDSVIVNADSMQVYNTLPILTAQPSDIGNKSKYELYSILDYDEYCSVGKWVSSAHARIASINSLKKTPIIVGGTGLYINALLNGLAEIPEIDIGIRESVRARFVELGKEEFYKALCEKGASGGINPNDSQRMMRAMEVFEKTGKSIESFKNSKIKDYNNVLHLSLVPDRKLLYENCDNRFDSMMENDVLGEMKALSSKIDINSSEYSITKAIGFRELRDYLNNKITLDEAKGLIKQFTRNYAKRQLTWFRNQMPDKSMIEFSSIEELRDEVLASLSYLG